MKDAHERFVKFQQRIDQLALMTDTLKIQEILGSEYRIQLSEDEARMLQGLQNSTLDPPLKSVLQKIVQQ
jgi:hypothetical protein